MVVAPLVRRNTSYDAISFDKETRQAAQEPHTHWLVRLMIEVPPTDC